MIAIESRMLQTLKAINSMLEGIDWVLTGSMSFYIQGMDTVVNDMDVQSNREGIYKIQERLNEYLVRPIHFSGTDRIRSYFGEAYYNGIRVELMGDIERSSDGDVWTKPIQIEDSRRIITYEGISIPVLDLEVEFNAYRELGRSEKAEQILDLIWRGK